MTHTIRLVRTVPGFASEFAHIAVCACGDESRPENSRPEAIHEHTKHAAHETRKAIARVASMTYGGTPYGTPIERVAAPIAVVSIAITERESVAA